jgi:hypothetical protein
VDVSLREPGASAVIYGGMEAAGIAFEGVAEALAVPRTDIRLFGKPGGLREAPHGRGGGQRRRRGRGPQPRQAGRRQGAPGAGLRRFEMKLLRYGPKGHENPACWMPTATSATCRACSTTSPGALAPAALEVLKAIDPARLPKVEGSPRLGVPWNGTPKYIAIGLNYHDHAVESGMPVPAEPVMFPNGRAASPAPTTTSCRRRASPASTGRWSWAS